MTDMQFFGGLLLAFIGGTAFGVWLAMYILRASRRRWREDRQRAEESERDAWNFQPVAKDHFDPTKQPDNPMGESGGEKPPIQLMITHDTTDTFERPTP